MSDGLPAEARAWLRRARPRPNARVRLLCFPHGGGAASAYKRWTGLLPDDIELSVVQYPGHEDRVTEPLVEDVRRISSHAAEAVGLLLDRPFALYGHSMGALVAFETALVLERRGTAPAALIVSGMPAPQRTRPGTVHTGTDTEVIAELRRLAGVSEELLADPGMREIIVPVSRNDYGAVERYRHRPGDAVTTPITVHRASGDPELSAGEAVAWADVTTGGLHERVFPGSHFHVFEDPGPVIADFVSTLAPESVPRQDHDSHRGHNATDADRFDRRESL
ncbi:oleoyl-ACP hydrolase [Nocardiopsis terrae]|uniref:Pyochelin biosynthetic protein PchC n=1 Tax=Nocardiopsis terrae TaxID=372655 RepID=A0ABR9HD22_9ACTN|nr:alpha/beta fold hydrolase [Nocardiopsis terrae]MBE1456928.1 pyochelin biosynthetic protein PchC [Nocardiopsis terrae]GHC89660.1 oleoyl-ACP hydrolase [Nocardiopsis terrae]